MIQTKEAQKRERTLLWAVVYTFFVSGAASQPLGSFIPYLRESYGFSYDLSGVLLSCQSIGNLVSVLISGFLPVYLGRRRSILVTSVWMCVGYVIFASGLGSPIALIAACLMTGIARGGNSNFSNTMVSTLTEPLATRGYNLLHGGFAVGALLSPLLMVFLTNRFPQMGWRIMAVTLAAAVVTQLVVYSVMKLPPEYSEKSIRAVDRSFLKNKFFWLGASMLFCYISTEYAIVGWLVTYFQDIGVLTLDQAQMMNSLLWLVMFLGRMVGAVIVGRVSRNLLLTVDGLGLFACFLVVFCSRSPMVITLGIAGVGLFMATIYPTAFAFGSESIKGNDLGASTMIFTGSFGGVVTPALVGLVAEQAGIQAGMGIVVALTAMLLLCILFSVYSARKAG